VDRPYAGVSALPALGRTSAEASKGSGCLEGLGAMRQLRIVNMVGILVGAAIMGFGINYFNVANNLAEGGITGLAILLKLAFDWDPGLLTLLMNVPLFFLGWKVLGRTTLIYTVYGTVALSAFLWLFGRFRFPLDDLLLASLFAGVGVGVGLGLVFRFGGTTGGTDIIARICQKYLGWKMGRTMFIADIVVLAISLTYLTLQQVMYTLVAVFVGARLIDFVQDAAYSARAVFVVSDRGSDIARCILEQMNRGATLLYGRGAYTQQDKVVLYVVVARSEIVRLKHLILSVDPAAFISVTDASEVMGEGFTLDKNHKPIAV
jgi:uncharacterized membrane-anchored protein YitT (DUF2179 family)